MNLFDALSERQRVEGWTDEELAREIGISRAYLSLARSGRKPATLNMLRKILRRFPEYTTLAFSFLTSEVTHSDNVATVGNSEGRDAA